MKDLKRIRFAVQAGFALYFLYAGYVFYRYYLWVSGQSNTYVPHLPSVEAFLPIGALTSLKRLFLTGEFDVVHPAALVIFMAVLLSALLFRKGVCGWVCPVGFLSNLCERLGRGLGLAFCLPRWLTLSLSAVKYVLLGFFVYVICLAMNREAIDAFVASPYNLLVDVKMLQFFMHPSSLTLVVLTALLLFSIVVRNPWCRFFCPYGALLGLLAWIGPTQVKRDETACIKCKRCSGACPSCIQVHSMAVIRTPECQGCMECVNVCPVNGCLNAHVADRRVPAWVVAVSVLAVIWGFWGWAELTGHWRSRVSDTAKRTIFLQTGVNIRHP